MNPLSRQGALCSSKAGPQTTISVILPTRNRQATIAAAARSVLGQSYAPLELLIVDDGSTDNTARIVSALDDPRIRYLPQARSRGAAAARNIGIEQARGEWIAFQDSDDRWHPDKLAHQIDALTHAGNQVSVCCHGFLRKNAARTIYIPKAGWHIRPGYRNYLKPLLFGSFITTQALLVKKELLTAVGGFDERLPRLQDWDLAIRLAAAADFIYLGYPLVDVSISADSISRQAHLLSAAFRIIVTKHRRLYAKHPVHYQAILMKMILFSMGTGQFGVMAEHLRALATAAAKWPQCLSGAVSTLIRRSLHN